MMLYGDCLDLMPLMSKQYNLILTDPPYGIAYKSRNVKKGHINSEGIVNDRNNELMLKKSVELSYELLLDNSHVYWFTRWDKLKVHIPILERFYKVKNVLIWDKGNWSMGDLYHSYGSQYECIIFAQKGKRKLNVVDGKQRHPDILRYPRIRSNRHPHEKPVRLLEFLIKKSTDEGEWVLDFFAGTGSTGVACANTNRNFTGIEIDKRFA